MTTQISNELPQITVTNDQDQQDPQSIQKPLVTKKITRKYIPVDSQGNEIMKNRQQADKYPNQQQQLQSQQQQQPFMQPVQYMVWPVAVQYNEDEQKKDDKILKLLERQTEMMQNILQKYRKIEEDDQNAILKKKIKELEKENEEIWLKRRHQQLIANLAQSLDPRLQASADFLLKPWIDQVIQKQSSPKKKKKHHHQKNNLALDPNTGDLWDPKTGKVVRAGNSGKSISLPPINQKQQQKGDQT